MKNFILRPLGFTFMLAVATQAYGGIYLIYGETSVTPVVVVDDQTDAVVLEEGYLSPHARAWVGYALGDATVSRTTQLPLAIAPRATGYAVGGNVLLPSLVWVAPTATSSPELSRAIQGGHAWSAYQQNNNASGLGLVYSPSYGAYLSPSQKSARGNRARAQAFQLDYYK